VTGWTTLKPERHAALKPGLAHASWRLGRETISDAQLNVPNEIASRDWGAFTTTFLSSPSESLTRDLQSQSFVTIAALIVAIHCDRVGFDFMMLDNLLRLRGAETSVMKRGIGLDPPRRLVSLNLRSWR
jgi:hypothetical protein